MGSTLSSLNSIWRAELRNTSGDYWRQDSARAEHYFHRLRTQRSTLCLSDVSIAGSKTTDKAAILTTKAAILTTKAGDAKGTRSEWQQACTKKAAQAIGSQIGYQNSTCLLLRLRFSSCQQELQMSKRRAPMPADPPITKETEEVGEEHGDKKLGLCEIKRQDDFRLSYLRKLSNAKVLVPAAERQPKHQTVIIFDWDDTLLCTRFLGQYEGRRLPKDVKAYLKLIEDNAKRLLERSLKLGHTFIITNAVDWWVKESAARWIPGLLPTLEKIRIISARSRYGKSGAIPSDVGQWKIDTFKDLQKELDIPGVTNLIAIGDSHYEMEAAHVMAGEFAETVVKTMKFRENPTAEELAKELALVEDKLDGFVGAACNLTMSLKRSVR